MATIAANSKLLSKNDALLKSIKSAMAQNSTRVDKANSSDDSSKSKEFNLYRFIRRQSKEAITFYLGDRNYYKIANFLDDLNFSHREIKILNKLAADRFSGSDLVAMFEFYNYSAKSGSIIDPSFARKLRELFSSISDNLKKRIDEFFPETHFRFKKKDINQFRVFNKGVSRFCFLNNLIVDKYSKYSWKYHIIEGLAAIDSIDPILDYGHCRSFDFKSEILEKARETKDRLNKLGLKKMAENINLNIDISHKFKYTVDTFEGFSEINLLNLPSLLAKKAGLTLDENLRVEMDSNFYGCSFLSEDAQKRMRKKLSFFYEPTMVHLTTIGDHLPPQVSKVVKYLDNRPYGALFDDFHVAVPSLKHPHITVKTEKSLVSPVDGKTFWTYEDLNLHLIRNTLYKGIVLGRRGFKYYFVCFWE